MSDMTPDQRAAARRALSAYPGVRIEIARGNEFADLTPFLAGNSDQRGAVVKVIYGGTTPAIIEREIKASCKTLTAGG